MLGTSRGAHHLPLLSFKTHSMWQRMGYLICRLLSLSANLHALTSILTMQVCQHSSLPAHNRCAPVASCQWRLRAQICPEPPMSSNCQRGLEMEHLGDGHLLSAEDYCAVAMQGGAPAASCVERALPSLVSSM